MNSTNENALRDLDAMLNRGDRFGAPKDTKGATLEEPSDPTPELESVAAQVIEIMGWPSRDRAPAWLARVLLGAGAEAVSQAIAAERAKLEPIAAITGALGTTPEAILRALQERERIGEETTRHFMADAPPGIPEAVQRAGMAATPEDAANALWPVIVGGRFADVVEAFRRYGEALRAAECEACAKTIDDMIASLERELERDRSLAEPGHAALTALRAAVAAVRTDASIRARKDG